MKTLKTLKTLTVALIVAASLAFCATSAKAVIPVTTNYDIVNFSAVLTTNGYVENTNSAKLSLRLITKSQKFVTKDLLTLLASPDFAGTTFPTGSKLVAGWDWDGDLLVVDKTGSNVLYDATTGNPTNSIAINFYNQTGAPSLNLTENKSQTFNLNVTWYNNASFKLTDQAADVSLAGTGPCTQHFSINGFSMGTSNNVVPLWTDSQSFTFYGANQTNGIIGIGSHPGTLTGGITVSGKGKDFPTYLTDHVGSLL